MPSFKNGEVFLAKMVLYILSISVGDEKQIVIDYSYYVLRGEFNKHSVLETTALEGSRGLTMC